MSPAGPLRDQLARPLRSLRVSVTDRCNLRCSYCMPQARYDWLPGAEILTFEEIAALTDRFLALGVRKVRLTGGEPLVRAGLADLIAMLASRPLEELAITTNGVALAGQARALKAAGLGRVTISLDTLSPERFFRLTRRDHHGRVLDGVRAAVDAGFEQLKLDMVVLRRVNDDELLPMLDFAAEHGAELRFIEYMDVGGAVGWSYRQVVSRAEILARLGAHFGAVTPLAARGSAPAERFALPDGRAFGVIASTTQPFCGACDRARLGADGHFFSCLYAAQGVDLKAPLRAGASAEELERLIRLRWQWRRDRGAEQRLALAAERGPLLSPFELGLSPQLEMHRRGG